MNRVYLELHNVLCIRMYISVFLFTLAIEYFLNKFNTKLLCILIRRVALHLPWWNIIPKIYRFNSVVT